MKKIKFDIGTVAAVLSLGGVILKGAELIFGDKIEQHERNLLKSEIKEDILKDLNK